MRILLVLVAFLACQLLYAQKKIVKAIDAEVVADNAAASIQFLAADEMRGRNTGSQELDIAANYIAAHFKMNGVKMPSGMSSYFQQVELQKGNRPSVAELSIDTTRFSLGADLLYMAGPSLTASKEIVFAGYGSKEDLERVDVRDKIVVTFVGQQGQMEVGKAVSVTGPEKAVLAASRGAVALVEVFNIPGVPWPALMNYLGAGRVSLRPTNAPPIPHVWIRNSEREGLKKFIGSKVARGQFRLEVKAPTLINAKNVVGVIEGTDAKLKNEWVAVSAHYDHVGVNKDAGQDSIFNGARDNAIGTAGVIEAARFFSKHKPKRSLVLIGLTAEEVGLLGSAWYADHPVIPLKQTIFDLNCDGAGYNDTTIATVIDFNRTSADELLKKACAAHGLTLKGDPAPEQKLFDRSDNANFARKGVPAVNISPGVKAFDQVLFKYYHQPADEFSSLNMHYLGKFYKAFIHALYLIANDEQRPAWKAGDKYEQIGKDLYGK